MILLFIDIVIDPTNRIFHLKYLLFGLLFIFWLSSNPLKKKELPKTLLYLVLFISFFFPFYALAIGMLNNFLSNTTPDTIVYFSSFFFFLLIIIIYQENIDLTKYFNYSALLVVIITLSSYGILVFNPTVFAELGQYLAIDKGVAVFGLRNYGDYTIFMMYYRTSPLLVFPLSYFLHRILINNDKKYLFFKVTILSSIIITLLLSGTRANLLSLFCIIGFYIAFWAFKTSKQLFLILLLTASTIALYEISSIYSLLFEKQEISNTIKHGHLQSYIDLFSSSTLPLFTGHGFANSFYSLGFNEITSDTELTYFEIVRVWGLPLTLIFLFILFLPIIDELKSNKISPLFIAYIAYLFIAGTNPFLLSSTGMVVLVYVFSRRFVTQNKSIKV